MEWRKSVKSIIKLTTDEISEGSTVERNLHSIKARKMAVRTCVSEQRSLPKVEFSMKLLPGRLE